MTQAQLPNRPTAQNEIHQNFEAITAVVNGDLRDDNIADRAAIKGSKLADQSIGFGKLSPGINSGDILIWNGTAWVPQAQSAVLAGNANNANLADMRVSCCL